MIYRRHNLKNILKLRINEAIFMQNKLKKINYWKYDCSDGFIIIAGKTAKDNDLLSLKIALPNDNWFHVSGDSGSHVVLHHPDNNKPEKIHLKEAASVAAWHSKSRNSKSVFVTHTLVKYVKKIKSSPAGSVIVKNSKKIKVVPSNKPKP
jgi:predicted ribosome quality control (RQC) complex YloA/Tae2 family protein|tara:strand:+ start:462 stop:911 length:450 start_codon:yes stop_codon:yes gene_type:complete